MAKRRKKPAKGSRHAAADAAARSDRVVQLSVAAGDPLQSTGLFDSLAAVIQETRTRTPKKRRTTKKRTTAHRPPKARGAK